MEHVPAVISKKATDDRLSKSNVDKLIYYR